MNQVLLVDDNPLQLSVREAVLRDAGLVVSIATNADSALATLRILGDKIGCVLTDHVMPECSGSQFVRRLRQERPLLPVIVLSGLAEAAQEYQGLDVTFRVKPFPPMELIELVRSCLASEQRRSGAA